MCNVYRHTSNECLTYRNLKHAKKIYLLTYPLKLNLRTKKRQVWICKRDLIYYMVNVAYKSIIHNSSHFGSSCSKHVTRNCAMLTNSKSYAWWIVTFGDGVQNIIEWVGTIEINGSPILKIGLYVVNLKSNLVSVGQLCDDNLIVMYMKGACKLMVVVFYVILGPLIKCYFLNSILHVMFLMLIVRICATNVWDVWTTQLLSNLPNLKL